ncbi:MAG: DUF342 domain-containing protein [Planctomycetota bacterium]|jgi:uncharacterized protein (DUF342 family)
MADDPELKTSIRLPGPREKLVTINVLAEEETPVNRFRLLATPNRQKAYLEYQLLDPACIPRVEDLEKILHENGINYGIERASLAQLQQHVRGSKKTVGPFQVACGTLPEAGEDGYIDWFIHPSSSKARYSTDEKGNIDYHETNLIDNALAGASIARLCPPSMGKVGRDIFGTEVETTSGKPFTVRLGANITMSDEDNLLTATRDGRVIFNSRVISIDPTYVVSGDVDLSIGNIDFVGSVEIHGNLQDNFTVRGREGVVIHGNVGASEVYSDGDIVIHGGVAGKRKARLYSEQGEISAKYINEAIVQTNGSITVRNEIVNSTLRCSGVISIPHGSIIGGSCSALQGIKAKILGSALGVTTKVSSGLDWTAEARLESAEARIQHFDLCLEKMKEGLFSILQNKSAAKLCTQAQRSVLKDVLSQLKDIRKVRDLAIQEREEIRSCIRDDAVFQINCYGNCFSGVFVNLGAIMGQIRSALPGPVSIVQNIKAESIASTEMKKLPEPDVKTGPQDQI